MSVHQHKSAAPQSVACAVVTVSDSRTEANDESGRAIQEMLVAAGHTVGPYDIVPDDTARIVSAVHAFCSDPQLDVIILTGGTGISPRDCTYEAVSGLLTKRLDGFGELFRSISYEEIGTAAMLSRAIGGVVGNTALFALPGSTAACRTAMTRLILPELPHMVSLMAMRRGHHGSSQE
jgi:molybdenum cofactor biosynthesis protein B